MTRTRVLLIGIDPSLLTFSQPQLRDAAAVVNARVDVTAALEALDCQVVNCIIDLGETAEASVRAALGGPAFDVVMVGAGLRARVEHMILFERVMHILRELAPHASLCFNTRPDDTVEAVGRWL